IEYWAYSVVAAASNQPDALIYQLSFIYGAELRVQMVYIYKHEVSVRTVCFKRRSGNSNVRYS
ncbi:MAG: hypothetical protein KA255_21970, partial [Candidatus Obscuribacter sp.]|nr:hypothetical protein [Candidatus Obscuribacter sp.]